MKFCTWYASSLPKFNSEVQRDLIISLHFAIELRTFYAHAFKELSGF